MLKKELTKWMKKENLIVLILAGVLLFIIALPTKSAGENAGGGSITGSVVTGKAGSGLLTGNTGTGMATGHGEAVGIGVAGSAADLGNGSMDEAQSLEYARVLEQELAEILGEISGVGEVKVMITLKSSEELIVEKEENVNRSATNEKDAQGGSRTINQTESESVTVYRTEAGESEPYVVKTLTPQIEGVLIVAQGAGSGEVNRTLTDVVQALFDLEVHKIQVVKMGNR